MKQRIASLTLVLALVMVAVPVSANEVGVNASVTASTTPIKARADFKARIEEKRASSTERREERKENILEKRASSTERRVEFQQNIAKRRVENVTRVMQATIERLEKIIVRVESRIAKIKERGGDTTEAEEFIGDAKINLTDAKVSVEAFSSIDLTSDKAKENFEKIRVAAAEAREDIRDARENLMKAVRLFGSIRADATASSTVEVN